MRWGVVAVSLAVSVAVVVAGCSSAKVGGEPDRDRDKSRKLGPTDLVIPVELRPVLQMTPSGAPTPTSAPAEPDATTMTDTDGTSYRLAEPIITIRGLDGAQAGAAENSPNDVVITLDLTDDDGETFREWTTDHVSEQLAMVVDGEVVFAPSIQTPITDGKVQINGGYTRTEAEDLLNKITGH